MAAADFVVLAAYFLAVLLLGWWFGRGERDTTDYFLGGRRQHWLLVGLSIIATEVSAITFIAVPASSFKDNWAYLQMYAGAFLGRILIIYLLLPAFYGGRVTTVYEFLGQRFGAWSRTTASLMFFTSRIVGSGIRLLVASLALATVFGWRVEWVILGSCAVVMAYTTFGGIKSIMWTDALQAVVFVGAAAAVIVFILGELPGDWGTHIQTARERGKFRTFQWEFAFNNDRSFWVLLVHATVLNMAAFGTDQDMTQRMLTCSNLRRGQRSLLFNAVAGLPIVCSFLLIGTLLWVYFEVMPGATVPDAVVERNDAVFPYFIANVLPAGTGFRGLVLAGVFAAAMSSLSSAFGAFSSSAVTDFYVPWRRWRSRRGMNQPHVSRAAHQGAHERANRASGDDGHRMLAVSRVITLAFGALVAGVAVAFVGHDDLLWKVFEWAGLFYGPMLGVFLLGVLTRTRGRDRVNVLGMLSALAFLISLRTYQDQTGHILIAWPWWVVIGCLWTMGVGLCAATPRRAV
jgi:SSS family transporter